MENKLMNTRTWLMWASSLLAITDLAILLPNNMSREDKIPKYSVFVMVVCNWIVLSSCIYSYKKQNMDPIHYALNIANLRYIITPCVVHTPNIGVNYKERYLIKVIMVSIVVTW